MEDDKALREHVLYLLGGGGAHLDFDAAVCGDLCSALGLGLCDRNVVSGTGVQKLDFAAPLDGACRISS